MRGGAPEKPGSNPLRLYTYFLSSASYRVRIALNLKSLNYEPHTLHLRRKDHRSAQYLALNPQGLLPALEHDGRVIPQSLAIIEYLEEIQPVPSLLPGAAPERALVRSMAQAIACDIHPLCNLRVLIHLRREFGQDDDGVGRWYRGWVETGFGGLEQMVAAHSGDGLHCFGDTISLADVCLVPQMYNARRFKCDLARYPKLTAISSYLEQIPAFADARPEAQPDARS